ncbi:unnamed protein product [Paramecium sonneborni]|uniref:C3H1-type domain-containing protein n=1 Tax=Paramecium sonneborni TaxID=65129 RepID=A0A8S1MDM7_9CILI|nr:unnamed protein product [Paramecium sonneborni]
MHNPQDQLKKALKRYNNPDKANNNRNCRSQQLQMPQVPKGMLSMNSALKSERNAKLSDTDTTDVTHYNLNFSQPIQSSNQVEHLDLNFFKIQLCKIPGSHSHKHCPFYHNAKDRKRNNTQYSSELCTNVENNQQCPYGDNCNKAHNRVEQLYRADNYKTKFCSFYPNNISQCDYGKFCSFAHSEADIVIELIHNLEYDDDFFMFYYKSVWCPFNLTQHDKALCVYAHNWQDFRRKPQIYQYNPIPCQSWNTGEYILEYYNGCQEGFNCSKCHGWKELEYHPMLFRTKQCINQHCQKSDCSFYHNNQEKRCIDQLSQFRVFKIVPRNRIVQNTFKVRDQSLLNSQRNVSNKSQDLTLSYQKYCSTSDQQWLGHNLQNSFQYDQDSDEGKQNNKGQHYQTTLISIQERTDSDELKDLKDLMRKKSNSVIEDKQNNEDNEHVRTVLKMIDMDQ